MVIVDIIIERMSGRTIIYVLMIHIHLFLEVAGNPEALRVGSSVGGVIAVVLALIFIALLAIVVIVLKSRRKSVYV